LPLNIDTATATTTTACHAAADDVGDYGRGVPYIFVHFMCGIFCCVTAQTLKGFAKTERNGNDERERERETEREREKRDWEGKK